MISKHQLQSLTSQIQAKQQECADQKVNANNMYWQAVGALALVQELITQLESKENEGPVASVSKVSKSKKETKTGS